MNFKLFEKEYTKIKKIKINGILKSSLRKRSPEINYKNHIRSDYMVDSNKIFLEYLKIKEKKTYRPKILIIQIILNLLLFIIGFYFFKENIFSGIILICLIILINWSIIWFYSLISIIKNSFKKKSNKLFWLVLILFIPFSAFFYFDLKKILTEDNF